MQESQTTIEESVQALEKLQDESGLAEAYSFLGTLMMWNGQCAEATEALERSVELAKRQGDAKIASRSIVWLLTNAVWGPMPVEEGLRLCDRLLEDATSRQLQASVTFYQGVLLAMVGRWEQSREQIRTGRRLFEELGQHVIVGSTSMPVARMELFAGQLTEAEEELRLGYRVLDEMGEKGYLSTVAALLSSVLCAQRRYDEAETYAKEARELGAEDDLTTQVYWRMAQAEVLASRGELEEAYRFVQDARAVIEPTDFITDRAAALVSEAEVERAADNRERARAALEQAVALFEEKGDVTGAAHARDLIAEV
jgi:tetratricopeptide (TPR) repeat protein